MNCTELPNKNNTKLTLTWRLVAFWITNILENKGRGKHLQTMVKWSLGATSETVVLPCVWMNKGGSGHNVSRTAVHNHQILKFLHFQNQHANRLPRVLFSKQLHSEDSEMALTFSCLATEMQAQIKKKRLHCNSTIIQTTSPNYMFLDVRSAFKNAPVLLWMKSAKCTRPLA